LGSRTPRRAATWFESAQADAVAFCRFTQHCFLRIATNPKAFGDETLSTSGAWSAYEDLLNDPRVRFAAEPVTTEEIWREITSARPRSSRVRGDAYLAAFARAGELAVVPFDRDFEAFTGLTWIRP
jgi:toxin-antitoxin system PIN domain toxin